MEELTDVLHLCRLCLVGDEVNVPIFEEQDKREVLLKISTCLPVKVSQEDDLPKKICNSCSNKLDTMLTFRNTSADSEKKLLEWLRRKESKKESAPDDNVISDGDKDVENNESDESKNERVTNIWVKSFEELKKTSLIQNQSATSREKVSKITNEHKSSSSNSAKGQKRAFSSVSEGTCDSDIVESKIPKTELEGDAENVNSTRPGFIDAASQIINQSGLSTTGTNDDNLKSEESKSQVPDSSDRPFVCFVCKKTFKHKDNLNKHLIVHNTEKPFACKVCPKSFKRSHVLKLHMITHDQNRSLLKCELCPQKLKTKQSLELHMRRHQKNFTHSCPECKKGFYSSVDLRMHVMADHQNIKYQCEICGGAFKKRLYLKCHMESHDPNNENKYKCEFCDGRYNSRYKLYKHVSLHKNRETTFVCDFCGKVLTTSKSLKEHTRLHTGIKPNVCKICGKGFAKRSVLTLHMRSHTGVKPYKCSICSKAFSQGSTLVIHMRGHTGEKPYNCDVCEESFVSRSSMNIHKKNKHSVVG